jgi:hypothetical protein
LTRQEFSTFGQTTVPFFPVVSFSGSLKNIAGQKTVSDFFLVVIISGRNIGVHILTRSSIMLLMTRKNYHRKKRYSHLAGYVFRRVPITTGKNYDWKKMIQSSGRQLETGKNYVLWKSNKVLDIFEKQS